MNRLKINDAKERILKLREKYSKNINDEGLKSSSESLISTKKEGSVSFEKEKLPFEQETTFSEKQDLHYTAHTLSTFEGEYGHLGDITKEDFVQEGKLKSTEKLLEEKHPSESHILLDQTNQFERICFIQSSSEELSVIESECTENKSISENIISSVDTSDIDKNSPNEGDTELVKFTEDSSKHSPTDSISSCKSLSKSEPKNTTKVSSITDLIHTESEAGDISSYLDKADNTGSSVSLAEPLRLNSNNLLSKVNFENSTSTGKSFTSISERKSSSEVKKLLESKENPLRSSSDEKVDAGKKAKSNFIRQQKKSKNKEENVSVEILVQSKNSDEQAVSDKKAKSNRIKQQKHSTNKKEYVPAERLLQSKIYPRGVLIHEVPNADQNRCIGYASKSTNTDPVKVTLLRNVRKRSPRAHKTCTDQHYVRRKKVDLFSKLNKRPFIKPCLLINKNEMKNLESQSHFDQESQHALKHTFTGDVIYNSPVNACNGLNCDEVMSYLLRSQIQLTRHFMESHQRMYMQVCQTAQMLNENYSPSH